MDVAEVTRLCQGFGVPRESGVRDQDLPLCLASETTNPRRAEGSTLAGARQGNLSR
jgi:hypothetical protein